MIDQHVRKYLPRFTEPLIEFYSRCQLTPNQVTIFGMLFGFIAAGLVAIEWYGVAIGCWWLGRLLDGTDGIYARARDQTTVLGAYLDIGCDMAAYSAMIVGFSFAHPELAMHWIWILVFYVLCITTALSLGHAEEKLGIGYDQNRGMRLGAGLAEGGETGVAYTLFCFFPESITWLSLLWIAVLIITIVARTLLASRVLEKH